MTLDQFRRLAETWGGDIERWPAATRDAARQFAATLEGERVLDEQARLGDFWIPNRGIFSFGQAYFEPFDDAKHSSATSRTDQTAAVTADFFRKSRRVVWGVVVWGLVIAGSSR